ncbi:MAG: GIY-YIG nuclease family protein [Pseudoxanthomonas sp.]
MTCFTYVFPCVVEDHCKVGFSRDPLARLQSFHRRWFEFFDLDRAILVEAETRRDARDLELELRRPLRPHQAPVPMTIRRQAGGHTDWLRGAYAALAAQAMELQHRGHTVHADARPWLAGAMLERADRLYSWAATHFPDGAANAGPAELQLLADVLDAYRAMGIDTAPWLPAEIVQLDQAGLRAGRA